MEDGLLFERLQAQLRASANTIFDREDVPPFACYFNPDDTGPHANVAMPLTAADGRITAALDKVAASFEARGCVPRVEYLEPFAPALAHSLSAYGFICAEQNLLMISTPASAKPALASENLDILHIDVAAPVELVQDFVTVQSRAFADQNGPAATVAEAIRFRTRFASVELFVAQLDGIPVGAGSLTKPHDGIAEVAGISTLPTYRRRGIAAAITAHIVGFGFAQGLRALFLTAGDEAAGRIYQRVGFAPRGYALAFAVP